MIQKPRFAIASMVICLTLCFAAAGRAQDAAPALAAAPDPVAKPDPAAKPDPVAADRGWTTNWSFNDVDIAKLFSRLEWIGIDVPIEADGRVSVRLEVTVPTTNLSDARAYRLRGRIASAGLRIEDMDVERFAANVVYDDGVFQLSELTGRWSDAGSPGEEGSFTGSARLAVVPPGNADVQLETDSLPIGPLHDLVFGLGFDTPPASVNGRVTGTINVTAPLGSIGDVSTWNAAANLNVANLQSGDSLPLVIDTGPVTIDGGIVTAEQIVVTSPDASDVRLTASAKVQLAGRQLFAMAIRGNDVPLGTLSQLASSQTSLSNLADGKLDIDLVGQGELANRTWNVTGRIASPALSVVSQDLGLIEHRVEFDADHLAFIPLSDPPSSEAMRIETVRLDYAIGDDAIDFTNLTAGVFGGSIRGRATIPTGDTGTYDVDISWNDIAPVIGLQPFLPAGVPASRMKLTAATSGSVDWNVPVGELNVPASHTGTAKINLEQLTLADADIAGGEVTLSAADASIRLAGQGSVLGGNFTVDTTSAAEAGDDWSTWLKRFPIGTVNVESVDLGQAAAVVAPRSTRRLRGKASAAITLTPDDEPGADVLVNFNVASLSIDGRSLSRGIDGKIRLVDGVVLIDRASGAYASGRIYATGRWRPNDGDKRAQVRFSGIDAADGLMPISMAVADRVTGMVSGNLSISGVTDLRLRGVVTARDSTLYSIATGTVDSGVTGRYNLENGRWNVKLGSISGELAGGQIGGMAELSSVPGLSGAFNLDSRFRASRVDFGRLLSQTGTTTSLASGKVAGDLTLSGQRIRGVADLSGQFAAELSQTQASAIPGLLKANQFLGVVSLVGTRFERGKAVGRIGAGAFQVQEFSLASDRVRVFAEGRVGIADLRMDMDAVISTGSLDGDNARLLAFAAQLAIESALPITTLVEINRLVSNRTVHFDVTGPATNPRVKLDSAETIREEAGRFLIREALVLAAGGGNSGNNLFD